MATRGEKDSDWSSFVYWVCVSLIKAEEDGINSTNFEGKIPDVRLFGPEFEWMFRGPAIMAATMGRFTSVIRIHLFRELIAKICSTMEVLY